MKKLILFFLIGIIVTTNQAIAQENPASGNSYEGYSKWNLELGAGLSGSARAHDLDSQTGLFSNTSNPFSGLSFRAGVRYNFNEAFGLRFRGFYSTINADTDRSNFDYSSSYIQTNLEAVLNIGNLGAFGNRDKKFNFQTYFGLGAGFLSPEFNDATDYTYNLTFGITPMFKLNDNLSLVFDANLVAVTDMDTNWSGRTRIDPNVSRDFDGILTNYTLGLNISLGKASKNIDWFYNNENEVIRNKIAELEKRVKKLEDDKCEDENENGICDNIEEYLGKNYITKNEGDKIINNIYNSFYNKLLEGEKLNIFFGYDQAEPEKGSIADINALIDFMKENSDKNIILTGYADMKGSDKYNEKLSLKRAEFIKTLLTQAGINESRVDVVAGGKNQTYNTESTYVRMLARRVSVKLK